ncbi:LIM domain only protein 7-like isoform X15 [Sinocyclocheilus rhinocerous]|uniref:LIM domain only protein 7-like isoform X15 n=1 Tax=Sinocyclocheilus rhinocerous TaxID=307959 RepID=UPI0007BA0B8A|nr:PREDICTED: LIM domain only protein 7-like isoform X15 [Sinocyclocheilus rhinocerous]
MEWRPQSAVGYEAAYSEAQRWIEAVTKKKFGSSNFRSSLENGLLLCDLINKIRPGVVKKLNRLSTPIAGLDNINLFLKACAKLGLKEAQLFHPGDLQDLSTRVTVKPQESSRRLKNVLITIYWLGRKAHADPFYNGPYLKLKAFEGLLGTALYKALEDCTSLRGRVRNSSCRDSWYSEKEELFPLRAGHRREDSLDSLDSLGSRTYSTSSDATLKGNSEGCGSDPEADLSFMMSEYKEYRRSQVIAPKATTQYNQFLPSKEKQSGYVPAPLRKKRAERNDDNRRSWASPMYTEDDGSFTSPSHESAGSDPSSITGLKSQTAAHPSLAYEYESSDSDTDRMDPDMVLDDLASRRFHSHSSVAPTNFAIPMSQLEAAAIPCTTRSQVAVSNVSRQTLTHLSLLQKSSGIEGSKSVSDITDSETNLSNSTMELRFEELQKMRNRIKENEDKWQDDLTRWKNKRRSVNSDIVKKKEEREQIEQNTSGTRKSKTFKEMQDERESQEQSNYRDSFNSITDDVFEEPVPRSRTLPVRSYTIDTPYTPMDKPSVPSIPSLREKEPVAGTLASDQTDFSTKRDRSSPDIPLKMSNNIVESQTTTQSLLDDPVPAFSNSNSSLIKPTSAIKPTSVSKPSSILISSELISSTKPVKNSSGLVSSLYKPNSMDIKQSGLDQVSASLPRSYQRSDSARLTSVVTPRPFGTQSNRIASLPRAFTMDDSLKRTNGETDSLKKTTVSNRSAQYVKDEDTSQESPVQSSDEEEKTQSPVPPFNRVSSLPKSPSPLIPPNEVDYSEMRISLNQKPNSSRDFGFQSDWDSTGVRVKTVVPGSPAQHGQVKVGDEILTVNGHRVADMNYNEWKNSMAEALQQGSLLMDICRHGKNNWGRDLPSLPFKSHKTINLTSLDPLGPSEPYLSTSLDFTSQQTKDTVVKTVNVSSQPGNNYGSNGINGGFHEDSETVNNKESESITMKNLKRRSEFFEQGGSDTAISNLPIPSITTSTERYSWDPEEERRRHEKWQKEQERLLQEKYKKDQEKLDEEWRKAQKELEKESFKKHEEEMLRLEEERRKREEQEHLEEEKKKREEERKKREEERLRLEEERRKRQEQERFEEEKKKREEEEMKKRELERLLLEEKRRRREEQEHLEEQRRKREEEERFLREKERNRREEERRRLEEQKRFQEQDHSKVDYFGYTNVYPQLSYSHRSISKSTPELDEVEKPDIKAASSGLGEFSRDYKKEPLSQSEVERQQILQEMKKKTSLNTDNSWIRQQTSAGVTAKEPIDLPIRRGESLDNLDMPRSSWSSSWSTSNSTSSIPDYSRPHSSLSGSLSHQSGRPGSATLQSSQSMSSLRQSWSPSAPTPEPEPRVPPRNRSVSGRKICSFCNTPLGKGAAMIIESLGLCYHLSCFKCFNCRSDLGGSEAGAEVRIRNQQLYCNACYIRLKTGQPTAL